LLLSGAELWITNVFVFALWYWRLDAAGPRCAKSRVSCSRSFLFPQMQIEKASAERLRAKMRPAFHRLSFRAFTHSSTFGPTDAPLLADGQKSRHVAIFISLSIVVLLISRAVGCFIFSSFQWETFKNWNAFAHKS